MSEDVVVFSHGKESGPWGTKIMALADIARASGWRVESVDYRGLDSVDDRLERLLEGKVIRHIPAADGSKRQAYELTDKGPALRPVLRSMRDWGLKWEPGTEARLEPA